MSTWSMSGLDISLVAVTGYFSVIAVLLLPTLRGIAADLRHGVPMRTIRSDRLAEDAELDQPAVYTLPSAITTRRIMVLQNTLQRKTMF